MKKTNLQQRARFQSGGQRKFLEKCLLEVNMKRSELAHMANIHPRTLFDWQREKYSMNLSSLKSICEKLNKGQPRNVKILPAYWSLEKACKLGGQKYAELYGSPGTADGRRKGGIASQHKFMSDPNYAEKMKFILRKRIRYPARSPLLAEFVGIMLGDGGFRNDYQITVSFNGKKDRAYAANIRKMAKRLFGISSVLYIREENGRADIVITARNLVEFLQKIGIKKCNKVKNQIDVPKWIFTRKEYETACLRGLFDTDGCIYQHRYSVSGKKYRYIKMCFRNYSIPILISLEKILKHLGFSPALDIKHKSVYLNNPIEVKKYFTRVGTSNPRYYNRYIRFFSKKIGRLGEVA